MVSFMIEAGHPEETAGHFWALMGLLSIVAGPLWGLLSDRWSRGDVRIAAMAVVTIGMLLLDQSAPMFFAHFLLVSLLAEWRVDPVPGKRYGSGSPALHAHSQRLRHSLFRQRQAVGSSGTTGLAIRHHRLLPQRIQLCRHRPCRRGRPEPSDPALPSPIQPHRTVPAAIGCLASLRRHLISPTAT